MMGLRGYQIVGGGQCLEKGTGVNLLKFLQDFVRKRKANGL